jgi:hypothetical protein
MCRHPATAVKKASFSWYEENNNADTTKQETESEKQCE